jgi:hypothetical protein
MLDLIGERMALNMSIFRRLRSDFLGSRKKAANTARKHSYGMVTVRDESREQYRRFLAGEVSAPGYHVYVRKEASDARDALNRMQIKTYRSPVL